MNPSSQALLQLAEAAARAAGELLLGGQGQPLAVATKSTPTDVVTQMDTSSERLIVDILRSERPHDEVLAEEGVASAETGLAPAGPPGAVRWVIDPLDGTVNYLYGLPVWAVSIAAEVEGEAVCGIVHAPALRRTWTALRGEGAWSEGARLTVSGCVELHQALVATGFGYDAKRRADQGAVVARLLPKVRDVRRMGAAAIDLCLMAEGAVDAYYEQGLQPWDLAAGALIAQESGGLVTGLTGGRADENIVVAAPPGLAGAFRAALQAAGAGVGGAEGAPSEPLHD